MTDEDKDWTDEFWSILKTGALWVALAASIGLLMGVIYGVAR